MDRKVSALAKAIESSNTAETGYWRWHTKERAVDAAFAQGILRLTQEHLAAIENNVSVEEEGRNVLSGSMGRAGVLDEAIMRRLVVMERQAAAIASQIEPLREVIRLLAPFANAGSRVPDT
jgi:hypothetical protein